MKARVARWRDFASRIMLRVREHRLTLAAAGVAFYGFLAFVPALVVVVSIYGLVANPADVERQVDKIAGALPEEARALVTRQLSQVVDANQAGVSVALVVSLALALFSASGGMAGLVTAINLAHGRELQQSLLQRRGRALVLTTGACAFVAVVVGLIAFAPSLLDAAGLGDVSRRALEGLRWPLLAVMMASGLAAVYRFAAPGALGGRHLTWGTLLATGLWLLVAIFFSVYAANFGTFNETYGSLASVVVLLLWLYLSAIVVLVGAEIDAEVLHPRARRPPSR